MNRFAGWFHSGVFYLAASFFFAAVFLRSILVYQNRSEFGPVVGLLVLWLGLAASEPVVARRWAGYTPVYVLVQTGITFWLLTFRGVSDFFAVLLIILSMQVMLRFNPKTGGIWIGLCALGMVLVWLEPYGAEAFALALVNTAGCIFLGSYALATRRAQESRSRNQALAQQLREANYQLQAYSTRLEGLAVARERARMARELHDSVTQTVFSMSLTARSAGLLLERGPGQVGAQLAHLGQLAQSAQAEIQVLITELNPAAAGGGLVAALRKHLASCGLPKELAVEMNVEGDGNLGPAEEQGLLRIVQEALNNVVKHSRSSQACIRLHLEPPFWVEVEDQGQGFDLQAAPAGGGVGLGSMRERAAEIGWELEIKTAPGAGTRIRVEKAPPGRRDE